MFLVEEGNQLVLVEVADLLGGPNFDQPIRSFTSSRQMIEWIRARDGRQYKVAARVTGGPVPGFFGPIYSGAPYTFDVGDILCGKTIGKEADGDVVHPMGAGGGSGWGP